MIQFFDVTDEEQTAETLRRDKKNLVLPPGKKKNRNHHRKTRLIVQRQAIAHKLRQLDCTESTCSTQGSL